MSDAIDPRSRGLAFLDVIDLLESNNKRKAGIQHLEQVSPQASNLRAFFATSAKLPQEREVGPTVSANPSDCVGG